MERVRKAEECSETMARLTVKSSEKINEWLFDAHGMSSGDATSSVGSRIDSASSGSVNLEEGTSFRTTGFSKGYLAGHFFDRDQVPVVPVIGMDITDKGITPYVAKHLQTYHVRRILSPFEFYLERESDTSDAIWRQKNMQQYYERLDKLAYKYSIQVSKLKCYVYCDPHSKTWSRVRVLDFDFKNGVNRAYIYYCDNGRQEYILSEDLRQLDEQFKGPRDSAILKCYLYDVIPISGDMHWSIDAIAFFNEYISDLRLGAVVMKMTRDPVVEYSPDLALDCGVVLTEKLDPEDRPDTINWVMVKMGYARSIGLTSCSPKDLKIPGFVPSFAIPVKNQRPKSDGNDKGGISRDLLSSIAANAMANSGPVSYTPTYYERPSVPVHNPDNYLPYSIRVRLAWVRMSTVVGPSKLFVHTRDKKKELEAMEAEMRKVSRSSKVSKSEFASLTPGSLVTCDMKDRKHRTLSSWCRAVVLQVTLEKELALLLMVDYGKIMYVHRSLIYQFPEKYRNIPSFVHRVHLSDIRPSKKAIEWQEKVSHHFRKYVIQYEKSKPLYYLHLPDKGDDNIVKFEDFNQDLYFCTSNEKWMPTKPKEEKLIANQVINSMKNDPLVSSYYCSHAVVIFYEVAVEEINFWDFANLSNYFIKRELAVLAKPLLDKDKLHQICKDGFGTL